MAYDAIHTAGQQEQAVTFDLSSSSLTAASSPFSEAGAVCPSSSSASSDQHNEHQLTTARAPSVECFACCVAM